MITQITENNSKHMEITTYKFTLNKLKENAIHLPQNVGLSGHFECQRLNVIELNDYIPNLVAFPKRKDKHLL